MRKTAIITMLSSILLLLLPGVMLFAQYDSSEVEEDMQNIAQGISELFGENVGSLSMIGDPIGYSTVPRFEVGVAAGAVFVPLENISTGEDTLYDTGGLAYTLCDCGQESVPSSFRCVSRRFLRIHPGQHCHADDRIL